MLRIRHVAIGCLCCGLSLLAGCGSTLLHETWKSTTGFYYRHLNPPASINYDDLGDINASQARLVSNMRPIDAELTRLERYMVNQDRPPSTDRVAALLERFRWVSGVVALSLEGEVLAQEPPSGIKPLRFTDFVAVNTLSPRDLRGEVQITPFGPEVLIGAAVFVGAELKGYYVAHFDIRMLVDMSPEPDSLIIVSPQGVLWPGGSGADSAGLPDADWGELTKSRVAGRIGGYYWICRYFGGTPLIFASPEADASARPRGRASARPEESESEPGESAPEASEPEDI